MGWGPRWLVKSGQFAQSGQSGLGRVSSRPTEQPGGRADGQTGDTGGCHCQCNRSWWAEGERSNTDKAGGQVMVSDRECGKAPKILGVPVNLPAETLEKGNATSLARKTCCVGSGRSVGRS